MTHIIENVAVCLPLKSLCCDGVWDGQILFSLLVVGKQVLQSIE
jgi:hypothetical protein